MGEVDERHEARQSETERERVVSLILPTGLFRPLSVPFGHSITLITPTGG